MNRLILCICLMLQGCGPDKKVEKIMSSGTNRERKEVIYQVFPRLFGNTNTTNKPWGTSGENGVGKFSDFTDKALKDIKDLGVTYVWYTGIPHHALVTDYAAYGIHGDDPDVVKGRAGSPYAVRDYYNVDPDLADDPARRLDEFRELIERTHKAGLKLLIDIVPNHVARFYEGKTTPPGRMPFGAGDDTTVAYQRDNNFYYIPGQPFRVPVWINGYQPLGGESHPLADGKFAENPAKWTGNGSRKAQPGFNDWYETVKVNYGIRPDGSKDFDILSDAYENLGIAEHFAFWKDKSIPDSWIKFKDIAMYWLHLGVDGFRYDMAETVPVEFWSYLNSHIKTRYPKAILVAEVYQPALYRLYIRKGKMDYLYDKVGFYDSVKHIMQGHGWTDHIPVVQRNLKDIEHHMLHFLENHDEQRIASPGFAGDARKGKPAMVVSATISTSPTMIYFGQEVGEPAEEDAGFGKPTRTSIFDYIGVPHFQRWVNDGHFDGGQLTSEERELRDFYKRLLNSTIQSEALMGHYGDIHQFNREHTANYTQRVLSYLRWSANERLLIVANFDDHEIYTFDLKLPEDIVKELKMKDGAWKMRDLLYGTAKTVLQIREGRGQARIRIGPLESFIFKIGLQGENRVDELP